VRHAWTWALLTLAVAAGCDSGPKYVPLAGQVTFDGQPIENGMIQFMPVDGTAGRITGASITGGRYAIPADGGPLLGGTYAVQILGMRKSNTKMVDPMDPRGGPIEVQENYIPPAYNAQTILKVVISDPGLPLDFRLEKTSPASPPRR